MLMRMETFPVYDRLTEELLSQRRVKQIPVDAYRQGNEFKVLLDLPGVDPGSIELTVEKDILDVRATRNWVHVEGEQIQMTERPGESDHARKQSPSEPLPDDPSRENDEPRRSNLDRSATSPVRGDRVRP